MTTERCGDYAECWEYLGKPKGWLGCSRPKGHDGDCYDESQPNLVETLKSLDRHIWDICCACHEEPIKSLLAGVVQDIRAVLAQVRPG